MKRDESQIIPYLSQYFVDEKIYTTIDLYIEIQALKQVKNQSDMIIRRYDDGAKLKIMVTDNFLSDDDTLVGEYTVTVLLQKDNKTMVMTTVDDEKFDKIIKKCIEYGKKLKS